RRSHPDHRPGARRSGAHRAHGAAHHRRRRRRRHLTRAALSAGQCGHQERRSAGDLGARWRVSGGLSGSARHRGAPRRRAAAGSRAGRAAGGDTAAGPRSAGTGHTADGRARNVTAAATHAAVASLTGEGTAVSAPSGGGIVFTAFVAFVLTVLPLPPWLDVLPPVMLV